VTGATLCLIVPNGVWDLEPLVAAARAHAQPQRIVAVWGGDPHRRPAVAAELGVAWADRRVEDPSGVGWNRLLVASSGAAYEWTRAAVTVADLLDDGAAHVVVLRVGSVVVLADPGQFGPVAGGAPIALAPRLSKPLAVDGLAPTDDDVIRLGRHSTSIAAFGAGAQPALRWLAQRLGASDAPVGPVIDRMADEFGAQQVAGDAVRVAGWSPVDDADVHLIDVDALDRDEPWHVDVGDAPARLRLSDDARLADVLERERAQFAGRSRPLTLPGGVPVDEAIRSLVQRAIAAWRRGEGELPPEPYGPHGSAFLAWLEQPEPAGADIGRYWLAVRDHRPDLQAAFPQPHAADAERMQEWASASWRLEDRSAVLRPYSAAPFGAPPGLDPAHAITSVGFDPSGVNVLGYLDFDQSLGHIARELVAALESAEVPVSAINHHRSKAFMRAVPFTSERVARYATNIVVVNADQFLFAVADHGDSLLRGRSTIAYWFWELEQVPPHMVDAIRHVDQIWTGSTFVANAFAAVTDKPVHCVPLPVPEPQPSDRDRASFGLADDRFVFVATFDQFSVQERKNPFGVIDAFTRAFADGDGPLLWIKTINGAAPGGWRNHERLLLAARGRSDIVVHDEHLSHPDQMAVLNVADCLVSLHRSEGLGLHCAEAMWLSKPVIATRYSGNLDFMDDTNSALVGYDLVPVRHGEGVYPESAMWAEPHIDEAVRWMRELAANPAPAARIGGNARATMLGQTSAAETGAMIARLARLNR
jgi:glycosyltransferase involved in cell wall biosynthesis